MLREGKPRQVTLDVTHRCQLRCKYCSKWNTKFADVIEKELKTEEWKKIILKLKNWFCKDFAIILSGGEPFLRTDLFEIIKFARTLEINVVCITNAFSIKSLCEEILDSGLNCLCVSLNAINDSSIHDLSRGTLVSCDRILSSIFKLTELRQKKKSNLDIKILTTIFPENMNELVPLVEFVSINKLNGIFFQLLEDWRESNSLLNYKAPVELRKKHIDILKKEYIFDELIKRKQVEPLISNSTKQLEYMKAFLKAPLNFIENSTCNACDNNFFIDPYGNVRICYNMTCIGNIKENSPEHLWINEKAQQSRNVAKKCKMGCRLLNCNFHDK